MNHERYDHYLYDHDSPRPGRDAFSTRSPLLRASSDKVSAPSHWFAKLLALLFLGLCLALGVLGVLLPLLPGVVFFGFAALIAAWLCPPLRQVLQRQPQLSPYLDATDGFVALPWRRRLRVIGWVGLKFVVDSFRLLVEALACLIAFAGRSRP
jgi:uncharacterized membrane protein YbaN (DUF454 family)